MQRGDLCHIPQDVLMISGKPYEYINAMADVYYRTEKPIKALFWDNDKRNPFWCKVFYKEKIWDVKMKDIYPVVEENYAC